MLENSITILEGFRFLVRFLAFTVALFFVVRGIRHSLTRDNDLTIAGIYFLLGVL